jgi:HD-GYP domain-containing protein (c-di-GMP phosphodiesterase class II)/ABC-type amino acid transport substrate-binding protein
MTTPPGKMRTSIRLTVVAVFLLATTLTAVLAIGLQYYFGQSMARRTASELYTAASVGIAAELENIGNINATVMELLASNPELGEVGKQQAYLRTFTGVMERNPLYYGIYLGRADSSFFEVINLDSSDYARQAVRATPADQWLVITVQPTETGFERSFEYLNKDLQTRVIRSEQTDFDVLTRPWYQAAIASEELVTTEPYLFAQLGVPGQTLSRHIDDGTVLGIDMTMSTISTLLRDNSISDHSEIYLYDSAGQVMASSIDHKDRETAPPLPALALTKEERQYVSALPALKVSNELDWPPIDFAQSGRPRGYSIDLVNMLAQMTGLKVRFVNGYSWPELKEQYQRGEIDLLQSVFLNEENSTLGLPGTGYVSLPYALVTRGDIAAEADVFELEGKSLAIPAGWSIIPTVRQQFPSATIVEADSTLHALELLAAGEVEAALDKEIIVRYVSRHYFLGPFQYQSYTPPGGNKLPDTLHIVVPEDKPELRAILDKAIAAIGPAEREYLADRWLAFESGSDTRTSSAVPDETMVRLAADSDLQGKLVESRPDGENWLLYVSSTGESSARAHPLYLGIRAPLDRVVGPFLDEVRISIAITAASLLFFIPLSWLFANPIVNPIRQLAIENDKVRRREYDEVERVTSNILELDELSESMVNMVDAIKAHELAQRRLMDSFIELIAEAIDDKSAYTGSHCERVPELAMMIAQRASQSDLPAFKSFQLSTDDQWREYRIAAWLHDCGKITTPEHIVDKGCKLETIYNRIHEVRTRFEVLCRDAEIDYWKSLNDNPEKQEQLRAELATKQDKLQDDYIFVAQCNVGGEFLGEPEQQRLREIARTCWQRNFDNTVGLSPVEELRVPRESTALPATETLLSDKPEHIIERTRSTDYPAEFGIDMEVPDHLGNLGEIYNLSVSRGTLTREDRFRINEHMISTIKMLESLPFPEELKNVPRYASTHHETMRGSGYPRKLPGDELSIPERILAVADIFEALTASDRPYKKAKPISEALDILHRMVIDNHVDRDCFELFVKDEVYLEYAKQFLQPNQIDEVDVGKYFVETGDRPRFVG